MHREGFTNVFWDLYINDTSHKYISMHKQMDIGMYKCKINPQTKISFTKTFLIHTKICLVLNKCNINPYIYELKKKLQFS